MASTIARLFRCVAALALLTASTAWGQARFAFDTTPGNLTKDVVPSRYVLSLDLDPARDDFTGSATISIRVRKPVAAITLHAHGLQASRATLAGGGAAPRRLDVTVDPASQTWRLVPTDAMTVQPGDYRLEIAYAGRVNVAGEGLYRADYPALGKPARMLATQLEEIFARSLFPAFDEPSFRAVFELAVRAPGGLEVVSNMPEIERQSQGGADLHRFAPTPPMPSYLVAVAVGRFDAMTGESAGVPLRILTAEGKREQASYAMQVTRQILPFYSAYFGVPYALPKLDQLAVPAVRDGAMEDWGLISYNEAVLLFDPARSSGDTQRWIFSMIAHEVSHQWFGNLVTAASWEEIWLNEAFATWIAAKASDTFNPDWQVRLRERLPIDDAMTRDAGPSTRAIRSGPVSETSVADVFDDITYTKGGAVLSMLEQWVGADTFRRGLAAYIDGQKFSNATAGDLWHYMAQVSAQDVAAVAASWTDQPGLPLVRVSASCEGDTTRVELKQARFQNPAAGASASLWKIPIRLLVNGQTSTVLLDSAERTLRFDGCAALPPIANAGGAGFYRVAYEPVELERLAKRFADLAPADRVTLLSDTLALAQAGQAPMAAYFALLAQVPQVRDASRGVLFSLASAGLEFLDRAMAGTPAQGTVRGAGRTLFAPELARLGWAPASTENAETLKLRATLIAALGRFDDQAVIAHARGLFDLDESGQAALAPSIRSAVIFVTGMHADRLRFDQLLARLKAATGEEDRWSLASALGASRDEGRAREFLSSAVAGLTTPNVASWIPSLVASESPFGELAYGYVLSHWAALAELAGSDGRNWLLPGAARGFNDADSARRLIVDQAREAGADGAAPAARIASRIELLAAVKQRDAAGLEQALAGWRTAP